MDISKFDEAPSPDERDHRHAALEKREAFFAALKEAATIDELIETLKTYAYLDWEGEMVTPVFMQEDEEYAQTVPHDGLWVVDNVVPLEGTINVLEAYRQGHLSEQQLYAALRLEYNALSAMIRITGVAYDGEQVHKIARGEAPAYGGDGTTLEGEISQARPQIESRPQE